MSAVYNEIEPFAVKWLNNLIRAGFIANGAVDTRSIRELKPEDVQEATQFHAFAGIGIWSDALRLAGWPDDEPVWTGSCPCQPFSSAGKKKAEQDERHLWPYWKPLIDKCRPPIIFGEQVASPLGGSWLDDVSADLEALGYAVGSADLCAASIGAPHIRQRLFWVAYTEKSRRSKRPALEARKARQDGPRSANCSGLGDTLRQRQQESSQRDGQEETRKQEGKLGPDTYGSNPWADPGWVECFDGKTRPVESGTFPLAHGYPARVGVLRAYGNAIVPQLAATFIKAARDVI